MSEVREISPAEGPEEIVWEKHSIEKVLREETVEMDLAPGIFDVPANRLGALPAKSYRRLYPLAALGLLLLSLTVGAGFYFRGGAGGDKSSAKPTIKSLAVLPLKSFTSNNKAATELRRKDRSELIRNDKKLDFSFNFIFSVSQCLCGYLVFQQPARKLNPA